MSFQKGDTVKVYQRPVTEEDYEGEAELVSKELDMGYGMELWLVRFDNGDECLRTINRENAY